jgi:hypothetical protein
MNKHFTLRATAIVGTLLATTIIGIGINPILSQLQQQSAYAWVDPNPDPRSDKKAPVVISGKNMYVVWFSDKGTPNKNGEVLFRVSTDNGKTFSDKINLSNSSKSDSVDALIDVDGDNVAVTWWEGANQSSNVPVMRISTDNGKSFGPIVNLSTNGTIGGSGGG